MNDHGRTVVGLDVHKETIVGVSLLPNGIVDQRFQLQNRPEQVKKMVSALKKRHGMMEFVYEAGPCGFELQRQLTKEGQVCFMVVTLSVETPDFERFPKARAYMSYRGRWFGSIARDPRCGEAG
jgi:hypothetical protein